jgi:hypothetical protein
MKVGVSVIHKTLYKPIQFQHRQARSVFLFYICGFMHHQSILLNNQRDAALSSCIYSSLQGYSTCFGSFLHPSSGVQLKLQMQP